MLLNGACYLIEGDRQIRRVLAWTSGAMGPFQLGANAVPPATHWGRGVVGVKSVQRCSLYQ